MPITRKVCPVCKSKITSVTNYEMGGFINQSYSCGHSEVRTQLKASDFSEFASQDGKKPFKFQIDGALFAINSNARCGIFDEMRLGKTVQTLMVLWSHEKDLCKFVVVCKSGLMLQWFKEVSRWCGEDWMVQIITNENEFIIPGVKGYVISYDMLWRFKDIESFVKRTKIRSVILDEVQHLKNTDSKRTNGVRKLCREVEHIVALSGTPIKNHAGEFFPILNILAPDRFPTKASFDQRWVDTYWNGHAMKYGGLKNYEVFHRYTKDILIRRTRDEVFDDFPKNMRDFRFCELGETVEEAYKSELKAFQKHYLYEDHDTAKILAYLTKMRHLTGIAKIDQVVDYVEDFLDETERKITIFVHHKDVAETLVSRLQAFGPVLQLRSGDINEKDWNVQQFNKSENRMMVASTLASGEGLNLGMCSDYIMMERQWNPANEEQAESRFPSVEKLGQTILGTYMTAVGTVDEFFSEIVEKKRASMANALDGKEIKWEESSIIKELADILAVKGGQKWGW